MDEKHLYNGANMLFDFIARNNIKHNSKIGKKIRNDNIVVRVSSIDEANMIIDFVKNNAYLQEGLLNTNPFTMNINGVGVAMDDFHSYNNELCKALADYIYDLKAYNQLDSLNINNFRAFLENYKDFSDDDLNTIFSLIRNVIDGNQISLKNFGNVNNNFYSDSEIKEDNLKTAIIETSKKYGMEQSIVALRRYLIYGNTNGFTRQNNARSRIKELSKEDILKFLGSYTANVDVSVNNYVFSILNDFKSKTEKMTK